MDANVQGCPEVTKTIYLANPYGFSAQQKMMLLPPIVGALEKLDSLVKTRFEEVPAIQHI